MGDNVDNFKIIKHRASTLPPKIAYALHLHRGSASIDSVSPEITPADKADLVDLIVANDPDSALNSWAAAIGGAFGSWWSANILGTGTRWTAQIRDTVT